MMKINISRQAIYLLVISIVLLIFVLLFSFLVLIPNGKEYRKQRVHLNQKRFEIRKLQELNNLTLEKLKELQAQNGSVITAFENSFNPVRFEKLYRIYFTSLKLSEDKKLVDEDEFAVYEVNTTSKIDSPQSFYNFLDALNKSDWVIEVNFPIDFKRDAKMIRSSFTMKVYNSLKVSTK